MKDRLFREPLSRSAGFEFNREVAEVFDDMLHRSIPFYRETQAMIVDLVEHFYSPGASIYDLGCSTGLMLAALAGKLENVTKLIGVDNSEPMIEKAHKCLAELTANRRIELIHADVRTVAIENAAAVILNYTLQFVRPLFRPGVVRKIYDGLRPGGILILSEKVLEEHTAVSQLFTDMYYRFKRRQGYSELEISQKRERLENVLVPYKVSEHRQLLLEAGFGEVEIFFKWHNFASLIAIKNIP